MIARVWHGWTTRANGDTYAQMLLDEILPGIKRRPIPGLRGVSLYRRNVGDETEFVTTLLFESLDDVSMFAGADYEVAVIHEAARPLLTRFDARSAHYDILLSA